MTPPTPPDPNARPALPSTVDATTISARVEAFARGPSPRVPGFELMGELGRGGMGVVYKAKQQGLNRLVALKMVLSGAHSGSEMLDRFQREAEVVASLRHPNIVQIYKVGEHRGLPYFAMEYVPGGNLAALVGPHWDPAVAAGLIATLAAAVHEAHERGIVHRDLKPANILLSVRVAPAKATVPAEGSGSRHAAVSSQHLAMGMAIPKITDFGLAKYVSGEHSGEGPTATGLIVGTPGYMAPEQASGKRGAVGPAADVYGLGAILYELLTGRPPFQAATPLDTMLQVARAEPTPPRELRPDVPRDLEAICLQCLAKNQAERYASAKALADDLRRFVRGAATEAKAAGLVLRAGQWCRRHPVRAAVVVLAVAVTTAAAYWLFKRPPI